MITEDLLFAVHSGSVSGHRAGIIMAGHCLPIACSHASWSGAGTLWTEYGIKACWESCGDVEEFFEYLGLTPGISGGCAEEDRDPQGLYVYTVSYDEQAAASIEADDDWDHLRGGELRRPYDFELEPLTRGCAPWDGVVL